MNVLVSLEGVLSSDNSDNPNRTGALLYYALKSNSRVAIFTGWSKGRAEHWLAVNGFVGYDELIDNSYDLIGDELSKRQVTVARSRQPVELLITSEPSLVAWAFENGIPAILFAHPDTMLIPNRPDVKMKPWADIEEVISKRNVKRSLDAIKDTSLFKFE